MKTMNTKRRSRWAQPTMIALSMVVALSSLALTACSETEDEEQSEYANWQARNEVFFASLEDSLSRNPAQWQKIVCYSKVAEVAKATDYIYVKKLQSGTETESPLYTDSVRVSYQGRLIPSRTYTDGYVFDGTAYGSFDPATNSTAKFAVSGVVVGWTTALMQMHRGDYWRVYIPSDMGYGASGSTSGGIPGYSVLIFDMALYDFSSTGETMRPWSSRAR